MASAPLGPRSARVVKPYRRSHQGCWTCRLRRKKCDETKPACLVCKERGLHCAGYDKSKPKWMDGGPRQQSIHNEIKVTVAAVTRMKRMMRMTEAQKDSADGSHEDSSEQSENDGRDPSPSGGDSQMREPGNAGAVDTGPEHFFGSFAVRDCFPGKDMPWETSVHHWLPTPSNDSPPEAWHVPQMMDCDLMTPLHFVGTETSRAGSLTSSQPPQLDLHSYALSEPSDSFTAPKAPYSSTAANPQAHRSIHNSVPMTMESSKLRLDTDINDLPQSRVFHPLHGVGSQTHQRSVSAVNPIPSLHHLRSSPPRQQATESELLPSHSQLSKAYPSPEVPADPLSLISEVDATRSWMGEISRNQRSEQDPIQSETGTAQSLREMAPQIHEHVHILMDSNSTNTKTGIQKVVSMAQSNLDDYLRECQIHPNGVLGEQGHRETDYLKSTMRTILWLHTVSRTFETSPSPSPFAGRLAQMLQVSDTQSCPDGVPSENWLVLILESINQLSHNRSQMANATKEQLGEVSKRAAVIQSRIEYYLMTDNPLTPMGSVSPKETLRQNIFLHALLIYLHVVAVGPFSESREIRKNVKLVIQNIATLDDPSLVSSSLVWPFCVTACLAGPEHHRTMAQLYRDAVAAKGQSAPRLTQAFKVMRECWELRAKGIHADWRMAAQIIEKREAEVEMNCW